MTGMRIEIAIDDRAARKLFAGLIRRGRNLTPAMDEIGAAMITSTIERFERGVGPDGAAWKPSIRARASGGKTLVDTGRLRDSLSHKADRDSVAWGTNVIYAAIHQLGGVITAKAGGRLKFRIPGVGFRSPVSVNIPARPYLGVSRDDEADIRDIITDYIGGALA